MLRPMLLSLNGWYPSNKEYCKKEIEKYINWDIFIEGKKPVSVIVPHAGWYFCGQLSINSIRLLKEKNGDIENVFLFGGHLSKSNLTILETFDYAQTPFGNLQNNQEVLKFLIKRNGIQAVEYLQDNTIEVLLPIIYYYFGSKIKITALYFPPNLRILDIIDDLYEKFHEKSVFIGSTDLTHYGPNYNFKKNNINDPVDWVKKYNDKNYVDLLVEMNEKKALEWAIENKSACSAGAALAAIHVAKKKGIKSGNMIGYKTSYDKHPDPSFVGYVGIIY